MENGKFEICIEWLKIESDGKVKARVRDIMFGLVTKYLFDQAKIKKYPKDELHYCLSIFEGSESECIAEMEKTENIGVNQINSMISSLRSTTAFKIMPRLIQAKLTTVKYSPDTKPMEELISKFLFFNILISLEMYKIKKNKKILSSKSKKTSPIKT